MYSVQRRKLVQQGAGQGPSAEEVAEQQGAVHAGLGGQRLA